MSTTSTTINNRHINVSNNPWARYQTTVSRYLQIIAIASANNGLPSLPLSLNPLDKIGKCSYKRWTKNAVYVLVTAVQTARFIRMFYDNLYSLLGGLPIAWLYVSALDIDVPM